MKIRHKKLIASGIALSLAGVLGAGALLQTSVSVQASYAMMPGIAHPVPMTIGITDFPERPTLLKIGSSTTVALAM